MLLASNTPWEHLFDNHEFCWAWCKRKGELVQLTKGEKLREDVRKVYYRNEEKDAALYDVMKSTYATFQHKEEYFNEKDAHLLKKRFKAKTPEWRRGKAK
eukprot:4573010-Ditylum_brightwellii.AAC.1